MPFDLIEQIPENGLGESLPLLQAKSKNWILYHKVIVFEVTLFHTGETMNLEDYRAYFSVVTNNFEFFAELDSKSLFKGGYALPRQPHGHFLGTNSEGRPLSEVAEVVGRFYEHAEKYARENGGHFHNMYFAHLQIREARTALGYKYCPPQEAIGAEGFPGIVPMIVYVKEIGSVETSFGMTEDRGGGSVFRAIRMRMPSEVHHQNKAGAKKLLESPAIISAIIDYFKPHYG